MKKKRINVLFEINRKQYKAFSIFLSSKDSSFFFYDHFVDESAFRDLFPPAHLLKTHGKVTSAPGNPVRIDAGDQIKVSFHPHRIYLKSRSKNNKQEHYLDEAEPQPFNKKGYRLNLLYSPPPIEFLPVQSKKPRESEIFINFPWSSKKRPEISLYEFDPAADPASSSQNLPISNNCVFIPHDGLHPALAIHLKETAGENPTTWLPVVAVFMRFINKKVFTKRDIQNIISYNGLDFDISSIPKNDIITNFKVTNAPAGGKMLVIEHEPKKKKDKEV